MRAGDLSESLEDYLETIYLLCGNNHSARVKDIAEQREVAMSSVVLALKRLQKEGFIRYESRGTVTLTAKGEELAASVLGRHEFVKQFLISILEVTPEVAEQDACSFEHSMSSETFRKLVAFFEFVEECGLNIGDRFHEYLTLAHNNEGMGQHRGSCPHGFRHRRFRTGWRAIRSLTDLKPGESGRVTRLRASNQIRQRLIDMGVLPNVEITMERAAPFGDPIVVKLRGYHLTLRKEEADSILLDVSHETE